MRKFILHTILFIVFSIIFYITLLFFWDKLVFNELKPNINNKRGFTGHLNTRLKEVKSTKNVDILFLGSSHTFQGFDYRIFKSAGFSSFNLGSSAQSPLQTNWLCKKYLKQLNPKLVVIEVYPEIFSLDGVESSIDIFSNDSNDWKSIEMAYKLANMKSWNSLVIAFIQERLGVFYSYKEPLSHYGNTYISGGYVQRELKHYSPVAKEKPKQIELKDEQLSEFKELLKYLELNNYNYLLVQAPISPTLFRSYQNMDYYDDLMKSYGEYYNFNRLMSLDDSTYFYDNNHLNQTGVDTFNNQLIKILKSKGRQKIIKSDS